MWNEIIQVVGEIEDRFIITVSYEYTYVAYRKYLVATTQWSLAQSSLVSEMARYGLIPA